MKVQFVDINGVERKGTIPEEKVTESFVRLHGVPSGMFTVYRTTSDTLYLMLYRPVAPIRPDLVLETTLTED